MSQKEQLIKDAEAKGLKLTGDEKVADLQKLLESSDKDNLAKGGESDTEDEKDDAPDSMTTTSNMTAGNAKVAAGSETRNDAKEEASFRKTAGSMKAKLDAEPKVRIYIPLENGEPKGTQMSVEINGYKMWVPKGVPNVAVPQAVADIIWQHLGIYDEASAALRSENDPERPLRLDLQNDVDKGRLNS